MALVALGLSHCASAHKCGWRCFASAGGQDVAAGGIASIFQLVLSWVSRPWIDSCVFVGSHYDHHGNFGACGS